MKNFVAISGSLRKNSYNTLLLKELATFDSSINIEILNIENIPILNQDINDENAFKNIEELKNKIRNSDGVIISTPEYNRSIPGGLKNTLDWLSQPFSENVFIKKPVMIIGASMGPLGTALAQYELRHILAFLGANIMPGPEFFSTLDNTKVENNNLVDEEIKSRLKTTFSKFLEFTK